MSDLREKFFTLLESSPKPILADGAMGTVLHTRGVGFDQSFDELNLTDPALVAEVHRAYIEAGSKIIYSNTFSANRYKLAEHGLEDQVAEINQAGVELARARCGCFLQGCTRRRGCRTPGRTPGPLWACADRAGQSCLHRAD